MTDTNLVAIFIVPYLLIGLALGKLLLKITKTDYPELDVVEQTLFILGAILWPLYLVILPIVGIFVGMHMVFKGSKK